MKIVVSENKPERKLKAVIVPLIEAVWLRGGEGGDVFLNSDGASPSIYDTLEEALKATPGAKPIYEGDSITITF